MPSVKVSVTDQLREDILNGLYLPGQALIQEELSQGYGVSRLPVREALQRLEGEGLVRQEGKRGVVVAHLDPFEAEDLALMRAQLEPLALELAFGHLTKAQLGRAEDLVDAMAREDDARQHGRLNWAFHRTLYEPAHRARLLHTLDVLHRSADRYMRFQFNVIDNKRQSQQEHSALLAALRAQDLGEAQRVLEHHIVDAGIQLVAFLHTHLNTPERTHTRRP
ncbi:GntR family transcriptional regulator [Deinococcus aetherius]|uniref:GntR family transcriptional regulator n=1 Tax=Deinococcus aetherius TaxID=200252 RepID=UPI00222F18B2|nr:GntR family transcriptional regulator [Deinococcus aetherius]